MPADPPSTPSPGPAAARSVGGGAAEPDVEPEPVEPHTPELAACAEPADADPAPVEPVETWTASGPPPKRAVDEVCAGLEDRARRAIEELGGPCETDDDCELVRVACPLGCTHAVSKRADRRRARIAFDRYVDECPICKDKCPALPAALVCEGGSCRASMEAPPTSPCASISDPR